MIILKKDGETIFQRLYAENLPRDLISGILATFLRIGEELGYGETRRVELGTYDFFFYNCETLPWFICTIAEKDDRGAELTSKYLALMIDSLGDEFRGASLDELKSSINLIIDDIILKELPSIEKIKEICDEIYACVMNDNYLKNEAKFEIHLEKYSKTVDDVFKKYLEKVEKRLEITEYDYDTFFEYLRRWDLHSAFTIALNMFYKRKEIKAGCLALKTGLFLRELYYIHPIPSLNYLKSLAKEISSYRSLNSKDSLLIELVLAEYRAAAYPEKYPEMLSLIKSKFEIMKKYLREEDPLFQKILAFICFTRDMNLVNADILDLIIDNLREIPIIYTELDSIKDLLRIHSSVHKVETCEDILPILEDMKVKYLDAKKELMEFEQTIGFKEKLIGLPDDVKIQLLTKHINTILRIRAYLSAFLIAMENPARMLSEYAKLLNEAWRLIMEDYIKLIKRKIPIPIIIYYDAYRIGLTLLYHLLFLWDKKERKGMIKRCSFLLTESMHFLKSIWMKNQVHLLRYAMTTTILGAMILFQDYEKSISEDIFLLYKLAYEINKEKTKAFFDSDACNYTLYLWHLLASAFYLTNHIEPITIAKSLRLDIFQLLKQTILYALKHGFIQKHIISSYVYIMISVLKDLIDKDVAEDIIRHVFPLTKTIFAIGMSEYDDIILSEFVSECIFAYTTNYEKKDSLIKTALLYLERAKSIWLRYSKRKSDEVTSKIKMLEEVLRSR